MTRLSSPTSPIDLISGGVLMVDTTHEHVHSQTLYYAEYTVASVSNAASVNLLFKVGDDQPHLVFNVGAGGQTLVYLYENTVIAEGSSDGTAVPAYNMWRGSSNTPDMEIYHTPTGVTEGTALVNGRLIAGGTSPTTRVGGGLRSGSEFVLKANTNYLLRATNNSGGAIAINLATEFYES